MRIATYNIQYWMLYVAMRMTVTPCGPAKHTAWGPGQAPRCSKSQSRVVPMANCSHLWALKVWSAPSTQTRRPRSPRVSAYIWACLGGTVGSWVPWRISAGPE